MYRRGDKAQGARAFLPIAATGRLSTPAVQNWNTLQTLVGPPAYLGAGTK